MIPDEVLVLEVERFAIHDGPGIRTVVFFQGCPLRCPWCANPESQEGRPQLLHVVNRCTGCLRCTAACPHGAVSAEGPLPRFDRDRCAAHCEALRPAAGPGFSGRPPCVEACPAGALRVAGKLMKTGAILDLVMRDKDYYDASGGGVTFSGGEPFAQAPALLRLLQGARERGLHTAVESAGQIPSADLAAAEPFIDCFLLDIKHAGPERLTAVTGADPGMTGAALDWLGRRCPGKVIARVPVIPGFNDDEASLRGIFRLALDRGIRSLELLPYHTLGRDKYRQLGRSCPWPVETMGDPADLALPAGWGRDMGLSITVR